MEFAISGMRCDGCARSVQRAAARVEGVTSASVALTEARLTVEGTAATDAIVAAVSKAGFSASPIEQP
jgi:copper chaperone CopZ